MAMHVLYYLVDNFLASFAVQLSKQGFQSFLSILFRLLVERLCDAIGVHYQTVARVELK